MTLSEFSILNTTEQRVVIMDRGEFVSENIQDHAWSLFFLLDDFYVEAVLRVGDKEVSEMNPFADGVRLERMRRAQNS